MITLTLERHCKCILLFTCYLVFNKRVCLYFTSVNRTMPRISVRQRLLAQLRGQIKLALTLELLQELELGDIITVVDACSIKPDDLLLAMLVKHEKHELILCGLFLTNQKSHFVWFTFNVIADTMSTCHYNDNVLWSNF